MLVKNYIVAFFLFFNCAYPMEEGSEIIDNPKKKIKIDFNYSPPGEIIENTESLTFESLKLYCTEHQIDFLPYKKYWILYSEHLNCEREEINFKKIDYEERTEKSSKKSKNIAAQNYKIHLMPQTKNFLLIIKQLADFIISEEPSKKDIVRKIHLIKFMKKYSTNTPSDTISDTPSDYILPGVVIYPESSQESTQKILNALYEHLKDYQGSGITPRFNAKVSDLIFIAQGDGDTKEEIIKKYPHNNPYFEEPYCIYYRHDFVDTNNSKTIYHLHHPQDKNKLLNDPN